MIHSLTRTRHYGHSVLELHSRIFGRPYKLASARLLRHDRAGFFERAALVGDAQPSRAPALPTSGQRVRRDGAGDLPARSGVLQHARRRRPLRSLHSTRPHHDQQSAQSRRFPAQLLRLSSSVSRSAVPKRAYERHHKTLGQGLYGK